MTNEFFDLKAGDENQESNTEQPDQAQFEENSEPENDVEPEATETPKTQESESPPDTPKRRLPKGLKPIFLSLGDAVVVITDIYELAGGMVSFDALSQIVRNSRRSSSFQKKMSALRSYGLIETENQEVTLSDIGKRIVEPKSSAEKTNAIKEAFLNVDVFARAYYDYCGRLLPQDEFLLNIFKQYVPREFAESWMNKFKESAMFARLLLDRGDGKYQVIEDAVYNEPPKTTPKPEEKTQPEKTESEPESEQHNEPERKSKQPENAIKTIQLSESNKKVWIGTDANMFEIKMGKDLNFVLKLIKLFDEYEKGESGTDEIDELK